MDLMLNAVEDDGSGGEGASPRTPNPPPPAFAMPVSRISAGGSGGGASLSSILSAASPQTPQDAAPRFELPGSSSRRAGLAGLMNSPIADPSSDREEQERGGGATPTPRDAAVETAQRPVAVIERSQEDHADVEMARDEDAEEEEQEEAEEGEEMEDDAAENDESPVKRRRGYSIASEASVSTPPPMAAAQSPASVALNADALVLEDAELAEIKTVLQQAIQRYLSAEAKANAPPAKRRKGKQPQKKRGSQAAAQAEASSAVSESIEAVEQCIARMHDKITMDLMEINVLRDVARISITFLGIVNGADPVCGAAKTDIKTALSTLQQKTVHVQLASAIRRVMLSVPEDAMPLVLGDVFDWIVTSGTDSALWSWLFAFFAQFDSSAVVCFLVHHAAVQQPTAHEEVEMKLALPVLEFLSINRSAELVDAVTKTLQHIATGSASDGVAAQTALCRLVSIGSRSPVILHALDDSFQWVLSRELVQSLSKRCSEDSAIASNGAGEHQGTLISSKLLRLIDERSAELDNSILQCLRLLQQLMSLDGSGASSDLARISKKFHADVLQIAQDQVNQSILYSLSRRLSFIAQACIELLSEDQGSSSTKATESCLESWKSWLAVIAISISRRDVTDRLIQADLTAYEIGASGNSRTVPVESITELLCAVVEPTSPEFVVMLREISEWLRHLADSNSGRYRLLSILEHLVDQVSSNRTPELYPLQFDHVAGVDDVDIIIDGFSRMSSCQDNWTQLEHWRATSGAELWEYLLNLITGVDPYNTDLSTHALNLLAKTPFPCLEDPLWQFRSIRKLTNAYFYGLRRYRVSLIDLDSPQQARREWRKQLRTLQSIIDRVCACNGAVAHYPSSVFSQFTSLWLDLLFSTASATSVPTHFPSSTKGDSLAMKKPAAVSGERRDGISVGEDHVVIRSERTISSKCTNLQSSQVITKHSDTLVYRKALDETWERELHGAFKCSALATKLLSQLVQVQLPDVDADKSERRVKALVDMLLERATPCCGVPSDDVYKENLPNRSSFDVDLRIEQWLNHFPAFLPLLRLVIDRGVSMSSPTQSLRLVAIIKSALVVLVGHWNSVKGDLDVENMDVPPYMRNRNQVALSCELLRILRASGWLPEPLARAAELLPLTTPDDIRGILFSCWFFLADHPPSTTSPQLQASSNATGSQPKMPTEFYVLPVRKALHRNIHKIGAKYASFMC